MRIVFLTTSYPRFPGDGAAPFVQSIAEALANRGHQVEVVAPYDPLVKPSINCNVIVNRFRYALFDSWHIMGHARSLEADVRLRPLTYILLPFFLLAAFYSLLRVVNRNKADVIYAHWVIPNGLPAALVARIKHIPLLISLHGSDMYIATKNSLYGRAAHWVFKRTAAVTACSPVLRDQALTVGAAEDTLVLPYGINPRHFDPSLRSAITRAALSWQPDEIILFSLGRMVYKKGFNVLLNALPTINASYPKTRLVLGGDGPVRAELESQARQLGIDKAVTFLGQVAWDKAPSLLASADIFILPSIRDTAGNMDGLPNVLLEAMSSGLPAVASDLGGVSLVLIDGQTGRLVPPGDAVSLAQAVIELVHDQTKRAEFGRNARRVVEDRFTWDHFAARLEQLLKEKGVPA